MKELDLARRYRDQPHAVVRIETVGVRVGGRVHQGTLGDDHAAARRAMLFRQNELGTIDRRVLENRQENRFLHMPSIIQGSMTDASRTNSYESTTCAM